MLEGASDASGSATVRLYCSKGFLRHYILYQFDEELLDQQYDDGKEKLLRFIFDQPLSQEKKIEFWKGCDGMIELSGQLVPVQVLEAPIPAIPDERGQGYEDMVLVLTAEQKKIRLSIQELFAFEESMHGMSVRQAEECNMLAKFMPIAASKIRRSQRNTKPLRHLATAADEGFEPVKLEPEDSHVGASVTCFVSATVRSQLKSFYVFRLSNGVLCHSTISQCKALTKAWKALVDEYVSWHVGEANSTPVAFLEQGVIGDSSDQGQDDLFLDSADEDGDADDF